MTSLNSNEGIEIQIRKFLKQVGVGSHKKINSELKINTSSTMNVCLRLEIDNKEIEKFATIITK